MAYLKIECSVARNRKFVKAGPAPSWLWVCGLAYCQEGLTDGFIPSEALNYLGVKNARQLAAHLATAGLWDAVDDGWYVHDYLEHNRSAAHVADLKANGKLGGRPRKKPSDNLHLKPRFKSAETLPEAVADVEAVAVVVKEGSLRETDPPLDVWLREIQAVYPQSAVSSGHMTEQAFMAAVLSQGTPAVTFTVMLGNLETQKNGHQWRVKRMIPRLDRWLKDGLWKQVHDEAPPAAEQVSARTARMLGGV